MKRSFSSLHQAGSPANQLFGGEIGPKNTSVMYKKCVLTSALFEKSTVSSLLNDDTTLDQTVRKYRNLVTILGRTDSPEALYFHAPNNRDFHISCLFTAAGAAPVSCRQLLVEFGEESFLTP